MPAVPFAFRLDLAKAVQAAGVLLRRHHRHMSYLRLLKLLYIADRDALERIGMPIIGGRVVAMDQGPLHSEIYDLIKGTHKDEPVWSRHVARDRYEVELVDDPGVLDLSQFEVELLDEVSERHANRDDWDLVDNVVHSFPEWKDNYTPNSSTTIPVASLLAAIGHAEHADEIVRNAEMHQRMLDRFRL